MIDHSLLHPTMTDPELDDGCKLAAKYGVASVCIKPYAVKRAVELLKGTGVLVGCVIGFPHGNSATESKRYETELACERWRGRDRHGDQRRQGPERRLGFCRARHQGGLRRGPCAWRKSQSDFRKRLSRHWRRRPRPPTDFKRKALPRSSEQAGADWVKTSTGCGFVEAAPTASLQLPGARPTDDLGARARQLVSPRSPGQGRAGGVRDLDAFIKVRDLGASRCGARPWRRCWTNTAVARSPKSQGKLSRLVLPASVRAVIELEACVSAAFNVASAIH